MTTAADTNTALSAITTVIADLIPQTTSAANSASAQKLQAATTAANVCLQYINDVKTLVVGF